MLEGQFDRAVRRNLIHRYCDNVRIAEIELRTCGIQCYRPDGKGLAGFIEDCPSGRDVHAGAISVMLQPSIEMMLTGAGPAPVEGREFPVAASFGAQSDGVVDIHQVSVCVGLVIDFSGEARQIVIHLYGGSGLFQVGFVQEPPCLRVSA